MRFDGTNGRAKKYEPKIFAGPVQTGERVAKAVRERRKPR